MPSCAGSGPCLACAAARCRWGSNVVLEVDVSMFLMFWDYFRSWFLIQFWRASVCLMLLCLQCRLSFQFIPQQQNAMGFLDKIDFGVFWASWGRSGKEPGSGNRFPRFRRFRCSMGSDRLGSVPEVWTEPVLGTGFWEPEVLRRFWVPEIPFPRFRKLFLCTSLCFDVLWKHIYIYT